MGSDGASAGERFVFRHEPLLGTVVELRIRAMSEAIADVVDGTVVAEMERLERVFSVHDEHSELRRWQRHETEPGPELSALLADSLEWQAVGGGAYNPAVGLLTRRWARAATEGIEPSPTELAELAASIATPPYRVTGGRIEVTGDVTTLSFNAFAKGRIVDLAMTAGRAIPGLVALTVNAGGDLAHHGAGSISVGIEDPARPYDNVAPLSVVTLANGGLATSGTARRGVRLAGRRVGHVIDPRTGQAAERLASVSVLAPDAATADVVATIVGVLGPEAGLALVGTIPGAGCLVVGADGAQWSDEVWESLERPGSRRVRPS